MEEALISEIGSRSKTGIKIRDIALIETKIFECFLQRRSFTGMFVVMEQPLC